MADTLSFYDYTTSAELTTLPFGIVAARSSDDTTLRLLNNSDTYQANDVVIDMAGTDTDQLWLSLDGESFTDAIEVGDLPPGAMSAPFWLRRATASTATAGSCTASVTATPGSWTVSSATPEDPANIPLETP